jgi:uncharacterized protein YndB with AHSA1/START domain
MPQAYDWSSFSKRINIKASPEEIYMHWVTQDGLERWFLRLAEFTKTNGALRRRNELCLEKDNYKWLWHGWPDSMVEFGEILEANGKDCLRFTFCSAEAKTDMKVEVVIREEEGESIVELVQTNIPTDDHGKMYYHIGCMQGWSFYLTNLKSILEGGIDLRNKNEKIQNVITA